MRQQPRSSSTARAARPRYRACSRRPVHERIAGRDIAQLGLVTEREERLLAAGDRTGTCDRKHLVDVEVSLRELLGTSANVQ